MSERERNQALEIINGLTRELKQSKKQVEILMSEIGRLKVPNVKHDKTGCNIDNILSEANAAMLRNVKRIRKGIEDAKQK